MALFIRISFICDHSTYNVFWGKLQRVGVWYASLFLFPSFCTVIMIAGSWNSKLTGLKTFNYLLRTIASCFCYQKCIRMLNVLLSGLVGVLCSTFHIVEVTFILVHYKTLWAEGVLCCLFLFKCCCAFQILLEIGRTYSWSLVEELQHE